MLEFIVLGQIPGTDIQISFLGSVLLLASVLVVVNVVLGNKRLLSAAKNMAKFANSELTKLQSFYKAHLSSSRI